MKNIGLVLLMCCSSLIIKAQKQDYKLVYTSDIDHFWQAYDSVVTITDTLKQLDYIQRLYVDKGTPGLKAFMNARNYDAKLWVKIIDKYPKFWKSIRANTLAIKDQIPVINSSIDKFKKVYPEMKPAKIYFTIGGLRSGGTTTDDIVLVGAEIATGDKNTNASELSEWLQGIFKGQDKTRLIPLNIHEYVHTQQKLSEGLDLLSNCIAEGAAEFVSEQVTGIPNTSPYIIYGRQHEKELKEKFKTEMFTKVISEWLYNGMRFPHPDLGYFMGYVICKSYYQHQPNKKLAIKNMVELDYANEANTIKFLKQSQYYSCKRIARLYNK